MARMESTRNIRHAVRSLMPLRPAPIGNHRLVRFLALALVSLLVVILALNLFSSLGAPHSISVGLAFAWMILVCVGAPLTLWQRMKEERRVDRRFSDWESDPRRLAIDRLGLDLAAGRVPLNLSLSDIQALEGAAADWRTGREALESLIWAEGDLALTCGDLHRQMDEAMMNLLAEAGAGFALGLSPFALERARSLFIEIGREAAQIAATHCDLRQFPTDDSIEAMRPSLDRLRAERLSRTEPEVEISTQDAGLPPSIS